MDSMDGHYLRERCGNLLQHTPQPQGAGIAIEMPVPLHRLDQAGQLERHLEQPDRQILLVVARESPVEGRNALGPHESGKHRGEIHRDDLDPALVSELGHEPLIHRRGPCVGKARRHMPKAQVLLH